MSTLSTTAIAGPVAAATFVAGLGVANARSSAPFPRPGSTYDQIRAYFYDNRGSARVSVVAQFLSAAALGAFSVRVAALAGRSPMGARWLRAAALAGGAIAVGTLAASAASSAALTTHFGDEPDAARVLHRRAFVAGGPLHGPGIGLVMGALGVAGWQTRAVPRWLAIAALATAGAGLLAPLALAWKRAIWLVPASRFPGLLVGAIAGGLLARRR